MFYKRMISCALLWLVFLSGACTASVAQKPSVLQATLGNGLRVVIVRDDIAPVATIEMNYLVGSNEAPAGFPGTAHALEHMMFRGSPGLSKNQLAEITAALGGDFDADTQNTVTQYYFTVPATDLDVVLHICAIRMRGLDLRQVDWEKERGAIDQEISSATSDANHSLYSLLVSSMFYGTPYAYDTLGTRLSLAKTTSKMIRKFYNSWYSPNDTVLIIVGSVDPKQAMNQVENLFGNIPAKELPDRPAINLRPVKAHTFNIHTDLPFGVVTVAYRFPGYASSDYAASRILADVLANQRFILHAVAAGGNALLTGFEVRYFPQTGFGFAEGVFHEGGNVVALTKKINDAIAALLKNGVPATLVNAAKRKEIVQFEFQKNSVDSLAQAWSQALAVQGHASPDDMIAAYRRITAADVDRVARKYLTQAQAITTVLTPEFSGKSLTVRSYGDGESFSTAPEKPVALPKWAVIELVHLTLPKNTLHPVVNLLSNGIRLIVQPTDVSNTVSVFGAVKNQPDLQQPKHQDGVAEVLNGLFTFGTTTLNRPAFLKALDDIAARETAGTRFSVQAPAEHFRRAVQLLADNELHPALLQPYFRLVRTQTAKFTAGQFESPSYQFRRAAVNAVVPSGDPTLRQATPASIMSLKLGDVRSYYEHTFRPDLTTIVVIGKIKPAEARAVIEEYFGDWKAVGPKPDTDLLPAPLSRPPFRTIVPDRAAAQDTVLLTENLGANLFSASRYALDLGNVILGGEFYASRLYRDLREETGLVYGVNSQFALMPSRGTFTVEYRCDPDKVAEVRNLIVRDLKNMQTTPVTAGELRRAKAFALRNILLNQASVSQIANGWLTRSGEGLPLDQPMIAAHHYEAVTAQEITAAFKKWVRPAGLAQIVQGPYVPK